MENVFDAAGAKFHALVNEEGQYSLWPAAIDVPQGWNVVMEAESREDCLAHIEKVWTDMRPASLVRAMSGEGGPA
jgi:MbtH protein